VRVVEMYICKSARAVNTSRMCVCGGDADVRLGKYIGRYAAGLALIITMLGSLLVPHNPFRALNIYITLAAIPRG
jgi:hypothetical protein